MSHIKRYIISPWETEKYVANLEILDLYDIGTKKWFESHKRLLLLNQQSVFEIHALQRESVKEWFISSKKIPFLIHEALQIDVWKQHVFPIIKRLHEEPRNTFMLFSIFYHETISLSLLEHILFHSDNVETIAELTIDLIDYAAIQISAVLSGISIPPIEEQQNYQFTTSCINAILQNKKEIEFDIGIRCISILCYLSEFLDSLPLHALSRMLTTHDLPYLFIQLIENKPWTKLTANGEKMMYIAKWEKLNIKDESKVCKIEGQVWLGLRELLLNPKCAPYYEITELRISQFTKLQKHLHETILDQISSLVDLKHWLSYLPLSASPSNILRTVNIEVVPQIKSSMLQKYQKKWKKMAKYQAKFLLNSDADYVASIAKILSDAYDLDNLNYIGSKKCFACGNRAENRCSKCKRAWYCNRICQVNDWIHHKDFCTSMNCTTGIRITENRAIRKNP